MISSPSLFGSLMDLVNNNLFTICGTGAPVNGAAGTGAGISGLGSYYTDLATGNEYFQAGTLASPVWILTNSPSMVQQASGVITPAQIIATGAGNFGHANGVVLLPAPGLHVVYEPISIVLQFKFVVAAYTAGGNITLNQGAGGAAITGLVSAANSLGNAASKSVLLVPLATVGIPLVENGPLNLVSSAAFTNPGTAAGTITWTLNYRQYNTGF